MSRLSVVIPAAGVGSRLGLGPKAWLELDGLPLLVWVARKALALTEDVLIGVLPTDLARAQRTCHAHGLPVQLLVGGESRQETVLALVKACDGETVLIQDVARPFVTQELLRAVVDAANLHRAAAAFLPAEVPMGILDAGWVAGYKSAAEVMSFQAPQAFARDELLDVLEAAQQRRLERQSTAQLWLDAGLRICPVRGEKTNIKLTTPEDWVIAQALKEYLKR